MNNKHDRWVASLILVFAACGGPESPPPDPVSGPSETLVEGETVVTTTGENGHYFTLVLERGLVVLTQATVERPERAGYAFSTTLHLADEVRTRSNTVSLAVTADGPQLEGISRAALFQLAAMRDDAAIENGLAVPQDRAGCNGIAGDCSVFGGCCDLHDKCLADNGCTGGLGTTDSAACVGCTGVVLACFAGSTLGCAVTAPFGGGCPSECCDQGSLGNICNAACSDATPGSWYLWGNHACGNGPDVLINYYCRQDANGYNCYRYDGRNGTRTVVTDYACDTSGDDYCNDAYYCEACPPGLDPACNPPLYTPGSFMDRECNGPPRAESCGDGQCNGAETCGSCQEDCHTCETCGNGSCEAGEIESCAVDCPLACAWYDCQGTCNGNVWPDACGVCGGDGDGTACQPSCDWLDCQGTCNGSVGLDACGVCGGDGSSCQQPSCDWRDCQGTCNGSVGLDACGVCGGDGSSCAW